MKKKRFSLSLKNSIDYSTFQNMRYLMLNNINDNIYVIRNVTDVP